MLFNLPNSPAKKSKLMNFPLMIQAFLVGNLTGLLGVGGGFLIVPVLILFQKFNVKQSCTCFININFFKFNICDIFRYK